MSNLKERAKEVHAAGVEARGDFTPEGAPKNMYRYWLRHSKSQRASDVRRGDVRENFCHFWRVVAIWGPLMFARKRTGQFFEDHGAYIALTASTIAILALVFTAATVEAVAAFFAFVLIGVVALSVLTVGLCSGLALVMEPVRYDEWGTKPGTGEVDWDLPISRFWVKVSAVVTFPLALIGLGVGKAIKSYQANPKAWKNWSGVILLGGAVLFFVGTVIFGLAMLFVENGFWMGLGILGLGVLAIAAFGAVLLGVMVGLSAVGDFIKGRRALARKRRREAADARMQALAEYISKHGHMPPDKEKKVREPRKPGKISKFFTGLGDFVILFAQVVRVNKWKICPLVDIDDKKVA